MNKLKYTGTKEIAVHGYKNIIKGEIIDRPDLVESLKHRKDFQLISSETKTVKKVYKKKKKKYSKKRKGVRNAR